MLNTTKLPMIPMYPELFAKMQTPDGLVTCYDFGTDLEDCQVIQTVLQAYMAGLYLEYCPRLGRVDDWASLCHAPMDFAGTRYRIRT